MAKPTPLSGFPELLPSQRIVELQVLDILRRTFELHGFASVETRAAEPLSQLLRKGEIDKEVYLLRRLQAETAETPADAGAEHRPTDDTLGLHFDLTVPFARYVLEHAGHLEFPFRRYQIQKVWRGERPQEGRYREFTQADIDIVARDHLSFHHDVEVARVMAEALAALPLPGARLQVNNRKLIEGFYRGVGAVDTATVMRVIDKLDKFPREVTAASLVEEAGLSAAQAEQCLQLADIRATDTSFVGAVHALGVSDPLLEEGLAELAAVVEGCASISGRVRVEADLRIARGLDYYTGTVFETRLDGFDKLGSICSGGRYESLASDGRVSFPGVGISLGVSRLLIPLLHRGVLAGSRSVPSAVFVALADDPARPRAERVAHALRVRGIPCEVAPSAQRWGKQIRTAERRGIPFVWFPGDDPDDPLQGEVKDIRSGGQATADAAEWRPPQDDLYPSIESDVEFTYQEGNTVTAPYRTHGAGTLRASDAGTTVVLSGWVARRRDHGGVAFVDLRDASGVTQVVIRAEAAHELRSEWCIRVSGEVQVRPAGNENVALSTGGIEVVCNELDVLSTAPALPFPLDDHLEVGEETRLKYRYLDLRRAGPAEAMRLRSRINRAARDVLYTRDFVEIETPTLTRSTPEGARDFLVPARLRPGSWYALPQSPQLFKQLLMVGGMERYFQIARCYRDEDFRADRQPEFTQLDIEMSFVHEDDVIAVAEDVVVALWREIGYEVPVPIPRITYAESMARYGNDKPDLRFGQELTDCTAYFADTPFRVFQAPYVGAVVMPGGAGQPRRTLDAWQEFAKQRGARGLAYVLVADDGTLAGPVAKNLSDAERDGLAAHVGAEPGDCVFFGAGAPTSARALLGAVRLEIGKRCELIDESAWAFTWVVDAPLFEPADEATAAGDVAVGSGAWTAVHHAFTSPKPDSMATFDTDPGNALAYAYDIVCNGNEIGGGSIRIHAEDVQSACSGSLGLSEEEAQGKFGFLLDALRFGAPPHGGIAFGWDRVAMLLHGDSSIREVIAFPKSGGGYDPLTAAPAPITPQQRKEAGIDAEPAEAPPATSPQTPPAEA